MATIPGLVSTIMPVHNRPDQLREAVGSVLAQSYRPIEVIVVDDGSTDDTGRVADELAAAHPEEIRAIHQPNRGPGAAREAGRSLASGEFIQYLDSDDVLLQSKFDLQVAGLKACPQCDVSYGWTRYHNGDTRSTSQPWKRTGEQIAAMFPSFLASRWWGTSTPLYRRSLTDRIGPWTNLRCEEDWEYDCRAAALGTRLFFVPEYLSEERNHTGSRLSRAGSTDPEKLRDRARAQTLILDHAIRGGVDQEAPEMMRFARELFLLSRQCGAAGLGKDSRDLYLIALKASGPERAKSADFRLYRLMTMVFGWSMAGTIACVADRFRR